MKPTRYCGLVLYKAVSCLLLMTPSQTKHLYIIFHIITEILNGQRNASATLFRRNIKWSVQYISDFGLATLYLCRLELHKNQRVFTKYGHQREKTYLRGVANNTGADKPAHSRSLTSASAQSDQRLCYSLFEKYHM